MKSDKKIYLPEIKPGEHEIKKYVGKLIRMKTSLFLPKGDIALVIDVKCVKLSPVFSKVYRFSVLHEKKILEWYTAAAPSLMFEIL